LSLGSILKETRIKRGISLTDVSRELLIAEEYLEAIEDGMDDRLPSETYKRIYTRAYCRFLGIEFKEDKPPADTASIIAGQNEKVKQDKIESSKTKPVQQKTVQNQDLELDFPVDINRIFRIFVKVAGTLLVLYLIFKFFQWIF